MNICREMRPASPSSYSHHIIDNRVQRSMAGWSVIEKITDFVHAVCRVSDGRGSAILVAIPSPRAHGGCDVMQDGQQPARRSNVGVLLTTSFVFPNREEAQRATVTFLEQPVAGTSAREGRDVEPLMVAVNADKVFLCSTARATTRFPPRRASRFVSDAGTEEAAGSQPLGSSNASRTNFFDSFRYGSNGGEEEEEELGYTLTLCELGPPDEYTLTPYSPNPSFASRGHSFLGSCEISAHIPGLFHMLLGSPSRFANNMDEKHELHSNPTTSSFSETGNLGGRGSAYRWDSYPIKPLPLPLLLSRIAPVKVGDSHLMITHVNGNERRYIVQKVKSVGRDSCEYEFFDPSSEFSSGGPIFDIRGDFVGLQHQNGDHSYGIFISSIVQHLFQSSLLGVCRLPIVDKNTEEGKFDMNAVVPDDVFNQPFHINQGYCVLNVGAGDQLIEYEDFERLRVRSDIKGFTQPPSLVAPDSQQVWKEFYQGFHSLIRILHAFSHAPKLTKLALERITSHEHREDLPNVASLGGIGVVLEIIDGYPQNEEIVLSALTVLARTSLYKLNREVIFRCDGVLTVLEIMSEYSHQASIQQWGFYCLYNLMADDSPVKSESIDLFARCQGIALAIEVLRVHTNVRHALRHACFALSCVATEDLRYVHKMVYGGITNIIVERMKSNVEDTFVFFGLATLLHNLLSCIIPFENDQIMLMYIPGIPNVSEVAISYCDETQSSTLDVSNNRGCNDNVGSGGGGVSSILLDTLVAEKVIAVLATAMSSECVNRYSSSAVTLLEACIGSVVVLLSRRKSELQTELSSVELKRTCEQIIHNFPTEKYLQEQAERIISILKTTL